MLEWCPSSIWLQVDVDALLDVLVLNLMTLVPHIFMAYIHISPESFVIHLICPDPSVTLPPILPLGGTFITSLHYPPSPGVCTCHSLPHGSTGKAGPSVPGCALWWGSEILPEHRFSVSHATGTQYRLSVTLALKNKHLIMALYASL
jgi:hypothetical protein